MKIFSGNQIKEVDIYTIENEPISSIDLMERASVVITQWFENNIDKKLPLLFVAGKGNNGGDGLAVARLLSDKGYNCSVYLVFNKEKLSKESLTNYNRLPVGVTVLKNFELTKDTVIVDAILGTGVSGEIKEPAYSIINMINGLKNKVISIDLPSGMKTGFGNSQQTIIKADITLTLQFPKLAMLLPEAGEYAGDIKVLPIGLSPGYLNNTVTPYYYIDEVLIQHILKPRDKFGYKNTFGHALLICGSQGMMGASVLTTGAAPRSGCGLVTTHVPQTERFVLQTACLSAMVSLDNGNWFSQLPADIDKYNAVGIGPGIGKFPETVKAFKELLNKVKVPLVIDADALNIISENKELLELIPCNSILTPHIGELRRLIGSWDSEQDKITKVNKLSMQLNSVIIVKGAHTSVHTPAGNIYFNSTGNAGMAKGGSGDVLTGLLAGLTARGYGAVEAAVIGVYFHGLAGDTAKLKYGAESMNSKDLLESIHVSSITTHD